jgi:hypothetical protein
MTRLVPVQSLAEARAERHARTFAAKEVPHCPHVQRLSEEGWNVQQIAMLTRKPVIDIRLILAGIEQAALKAESAVKVRRRRKRA